MKKFFCILMLAVIFSIGLAGCGNSDDVSSNLSRYNPFASKTDVYGVVTAEPKIDSTGKEYGVEAYSYDLIGYDKDLNKIDLGFNSRSKYPIGTYIKATKKGSDTRMNDVTVVKKKDVPENIVKKLNDNQK
ncbi:DUF1093 domain-containing protein (plasmid) [Bacillus sp. JAS24-2]|uniref:DUF1093 domain-containing protein n=1 Tax=Bacillus sp. JAS24-2 TaxID=2217832 RepID=UPI0011ECCE84|nr:DUF1093 domain-containing protein [Bacillus sp. JAS24-2]QEL82877.1 DUF1093 domain-containing protein [Bacillus sp. JAS24-2]